MSIEVGILNAGVAATFHRHAWVAVPRLCMWLSAAGLEHLCICPLSNGYNTTSERMTQQYKLHKMSDQASSATDALSLSSSSLPSIPERGGFHIATGFHRHRPLPPCQSDRELLVKVTRLSTGTP
jgi:hypothetical protein